MAPAAADSIRFVDIAVEEPDLDALTAKTRALVEALAVAQSATAAMPVIREWDSIRRAVATHGALVYLRYCQDTTSAERRAAREAWDERMPLWTELEIEVKRKLLDHPARAELTSKLGHQLFALWESDVLAFDPTIKQDLTRESILEAEYTDLIAGAELEFAGEKLSLTTISRYRQDASREVRHDAERVVWSWFARHRETLDRIYDDLVRLRTDTARKLGYQDFVELGYRRMCRVDYDRTDVECFRDEVVREVVPLAGELIGRQAKRLGVDPLMAWDEAVHDARGNPRPGGDMEWVTARARAVFDATSERLGAFFQRMEAGGFLDLASRSGKAGGGFCTSFANCGMPFVFANFNGTKGDIEVLVHEIGHAFQVFSSREQWPSDYVWPTYESCEIHSMALEMLTYPQMEAFFGEEMPTAFGACT